MKWLKKITDKIGYAPTLMLAGAVLPLAVFGAGELLSLILANLGIVNLEMFAMTISTGLTWSVIWPVMIGLSVIGLLVGGIIDIAGAVSKKIKSYKENKQISVNKVMEKKKGKVKTMTKQYSGKTKNNDRYIMVDKYQQANDVEADNKQILSNQKDMVYQDVFKRKHNHFRHKKRTFRKKHNGSRYYTVANEYKHPAYHSTRYMTQKNINNSKSVKDKQTYYRDLFKNETSLSI